MSRETPQTLAEDGLAEFTDPSRIVDRDARLQRPALADDAPTVVWLDDLTTVLEPACTVAQFWDVYEFAASRGTLIGRWLDPRRIARIDAWPEDEESLALDIYHDTGVTDIAEISRYIDTTARCLAVDEMVVFHGTFPARAALIKQFGLVSLAPADAFNPSGPGPFVAGSAQYAFIFAVRAAARGLSLDQLRVLPDEVPVSVLAMRTRAGRLIPSGDDEWRVRTQIGRSDVLEVHHIDARAFLEGLSLEHRITIGSGSPVGARARVEGLDSTPNVALPGIPDLRALVDVNIKRAGMGEIHGFAHSVQVADFGLQLSGPGVDGEIVLAFALLHDAARADDGRDVGHGARAADLARELELSGALCFGDRLDALCNALAGHEHGEITDDPTVAACWDADRLALRRFGIESDPRLLGSQTAREIVARGAEMSIMNWPAVSALSWPEVAVSYAERLGGPSAGV